MQTQLHTKGIASAMALWSTGLLRKEKASVTGAKRKTKLRLSLPLLMDPSTRLSPSTVPHKECSVTLIPE